MARLRQQTGWKELSNQSSGEYMKVPRRRGATEYKVDTDMTMCILYRYVYWKGTRTRMTRLHLKRHEVGGPVARHEGLSGCNYRYPGSGFTTRYTTVVILPVEPGLLVNRLRPDRPPATCHLTSDLVSFGILNLHLF